MNSENASILEQTMMLFMKNGIKSMTMSDIASNLGISKKTLYKHVEDKDDLVTKVMEQVKSEEQCIVSQIASSNLNAIDESFEVTKFVTTKLSNVHPSIFYDLKRYHPSAWNVFMDHKEHYIAKWIEENLKKGIEEGLYREDLNVDIIKVIYLRRLDDIIEHQYPSLSNYSFSEIYTEGFRYHIRGIASDKGIAYLIKKMKKEKPI